MSSDPYEALGEVLTSNEANGLAVALTTGQHTSGALKEVHAARREEVSVLLGAAGLGHTNIERSVAVLQAIAGAKAVRRDLTPVWTMPGNEAAVGHLTSEFYRLVQAARQSVTCATYNFEPTSQMWTALKEAAGLPGVIVTVYVDGDKADAAKVKSQLQRATIYRSAALPNGKQVVSHAKFIIIDHAVLLLTSANLSFSAENRNVELGLLIHEAALAESIEATMTSKHGSLYELV
jgi:phosphatidylserine/phosphatidylglycerophosphate/cardiolipin synthase-like enzyme